MDHTIRDATTADLDAAWSLNQSEVPRVGSVTLDEMCGLLDKAVYFRLVCDRDDAMLAFLVGLAPGADYRSLNYRWFSERYEKFAYIDRIAVAKPARRHGVAGALYEDFARVSRPWSPMLCCEVNLVPPNPDSMDFHLHVGFRQVGTLETSGGAKKVAMLVKKIG
jgi:predicted GNAT superfamily acetyltransferase